MNERIDKLAEQATTKISFRIDPNTYKHIDDPTGPHVRKEFSKERFAELIVQECLLCCEQTISDPVRKEIDSFEQGGIHCMDNIKQRFGVE